MGKDSMPQKITISDDLIKQIVTPDRFIPTRVGNTPAPARRQTAEPVHPHACGEHAACTMGDAEDAGSSPRVWGTLAY